MKVLIEIDMQMVEEAALRKGRLLYDQVCDLMTDVGVEIAETGAFGGDIEITGQGAVGRWEIQ